MLYPVIGAIISGAIIGDHVSPLSDTTVMASASTGSNLMDHTQTQLSYSIPIIFSTAIAFLASGFLIQYGVAISAICSLLVGLSFSFITLQTLNRSHA